MSVFIKKGYEYQQLLNIDEEEDSGATVAGADEEYHDFDDILKHSIGEFGRYQKFLICILCIPTCFLSAFATFDMVFIAYTPKFKCSLTYVMSHQQPLVDHEQCHYFINNGTFNESRQCVRFDYDKDYFQQSIVTEWNLVCDQALIARTIISSMNISFLIAVVLFSYVQDRYGRKTAFLLNLVIFLFGNVCSINSTSYKMFAVTKFIGAINFMWRIGFVWLMEFVGPSKRTLVNTILSVLFGSANVLLALIAYLTQSWTKFGFWVSVPFALLFLFAYHLPESPRWLVSQGRLEETAEILERMARWQGVVIDKIKLRLQLRHIKTDKDSSSRETASAGLRQFFRSRNLLYKNLLLTFIIAAGNQLYIALAYDSENLHENFYVAYVLQSIVEPPATFLNLFLLNRFGRIWPLSISLLISGLFCLLAWPIASLHIVHFDVVVLTSIARFFVCSSVAICEQLGSELYPTIGRGVGMSFSYIVTGLANISIQYIIYSSKVWIFLPLLIMGSFTFAAGFVTLFLPETKDKSLPDTVQQAENHGSVSWGTFNENLNFLWNNNYNKVSAIQIDKTVWKIALANYLFFSLHNQCWIKNLHKLN